MDHLIAGRPRAGPAGPRRARRKIQLERHWRARSSSPQARRPAAGHAGPNRPGQRRDRRADRGHRTVAGPIRGTAATSRVDARAGAPLRPGRNRRDRRRHDQVPHRRAPGLLGPAAPRWTTSPARGRDKPSPRRATCTWSACSAKPPWRSAGPRSAKAPATGGWPAGAARPKPASPSATPS